VDRAIGKQPRRAEYLVRLLELRRLMKETDAAFERRALEAIGAFVRDDVVARGDSRAEVPMAGVARVVEAESGDHA
jgi:hypothetical protein